MLHGFQPDIAKLTAAVEERARYIPQGAKGVCTIPQAPLTDSSDACIQFMPMSDVVRVPNITSLRSDVVRVPNITSLRSDVVRVPNITSLRSDVVRVPIITSLRSDVVRVPIITSLRSNKVSERRYSCCHDCQSGS